MGCGGEGWEGLAERQGRRRALEPLRFDVVVKIIAVIAAHLHRPIVRHYGVGASHMGSGIRTAFH